MRNIETCLRGESGVLLGSVILTLSQAPGWDPMFPYIVRSYLPFVSEQFLFHIQAYHLVLGSAILPPSRIPKRNLMFPYVVLPYVFLCFQPVSASHPDLSPLYCTSHYLTSFTSVHLSISHPSPVPPIFLSVRLDYPRTCQDMLFFNFLFRPILRFFLGPFSFHFTNVSLMTLRSHHS